jgi:hypothetical protein
VAPVAPAGPESPDFAYAYDGGRSSSVAYTPARRLIASGPPARLVVVDTPAR